MKRWLALATIFLPLGAFGQAWTGILNPLDSSFPGSTTSPSAYGLGTGGSNFWSTVGVGGIPARTTICSTLSAGSGDQTSAIQTALTACPSGQTVLLNAGTYAIASHLNIPANVTLRGSGADQTKLNGTGSGSAPVVMGSGTVSYSGPLNITAGGTGGSTSITLSATTGVTVGGYLVISEINNATWVTIAGTEGNCTWCDGWTTNGTRARGQVVEVEAIAGNVVTIAPGLYGAYTSTPTAVPFAAAQKLSGIEALQIIANNTGYTNQIYMDRCMYCWAKGIEYNYSDGNPIEIDWGYRDEVRDSYVSNAFTHVPGNTDSAIFLVLKTSASLVENNVLERQHVGIILNWGAAGNVVSYNYSQGNFDNSQSPGNCNPGTGQCVLLSAFLHHGAHPQFNLWEGNVGEQLYLDSVWGTSSHDTSFRGWYKGTSRICSPYLFGTAGRATVTAPCNYAFQAARATQISQLSKYDNFVGDVWGSSEQSGIASAVAVITAPTNRAYDGTVYNATFGYGESSDSGSGGGDNAVPFTSALIHGVYTNANSTITWSGSLTHTLPQSFYLPAGAPSWWNTAHVPYPANGPDITGGSGPGGHAYGNPAYYCYLNTMGGTDGGIGSPLTFNANTCYGASSTPTATPSPSSIAFGNQTVNTTSASQNITLKNNGAATLTITSVVLGGTNAADFAIANGCGGSLTTGTSCIVGNTFTPLVAGALSASVTFTTNDPLNPVQSIPLTGTGVAIPPGTAKCPLFQGGLILQGGIQFQCH